MTRNPRNPRYSIAASPQRRGAAAVYLALLVLTLVWIEAILAAPWALAHGHVGAASFLYGAFHGVCHQNPARSFFWKGYPLGVCSRCTAIYAGVAAGLGLLPWVRPLTRRRFPDRRILLAATLPMAVDFALGFLGWVPNTFLSRSVTGGLFGVVAAFYLQPGFFAALSGPHEEEATL